MICDLFVVISYITDNNANLPWVAWEKTFELSLDLGGRLGFIAAMMGSNSNRICARGYIA